MNTDEIIKKVLELINSQSFDENNSLPELSREELKRIVLMCQNENFITHNSSSQKLVMEYKGGFLVNPTTQLTRAGRQFLEGYDRNRKQPPQNFTINGNIANAMLGNYNTQNNYNSESIFKDLNDYINNIENEQDKEKGQELIEKIESEEIKPGYLSKFDSLLEKYPNITKLVSSILIGFVIQN